MKQETCARKLAEETDKHPDYQDGADEGASSFGDGGSTRPMSATSTPQPRMTLKLGKKSAAPTGSSMAGTDSVGPSEDE